MIKYLINWSIQHRKTVIVLAFGVFLLGVYSYTKLQIDAYPDISGVQVQVITSFPGRAAEEVEQQVTVPLEKIMASVPKVEVIRSRTIFGLSLVQLIFESSVDDYWAREVVFQKLSEVNLPSNANPTLGSLSTAYGEIYRYEIVGTNKNSSMELRTLNDWVVIPRLLRAQGVVEVSNFGGLGKQFTVRVDHQKMRNYGISLKDVTDAVAGNNSSGGGSLIERGSTSLVIRGIGRFNSPKEIGSVLIKNSSGTPVFVKDIGFIETDHLPQTGIFGKDANPDSVEGVVRMRRGENPSIVLANIKTAIDEINQTKMPAEVKVRPFYDRTKLIDETLHTVAHNTVLGISLVVIILVFFLRSFKVAGIVALTIPFSLSFALLIMHIIGIPISLLSVGAIDFGIIVDGSVIICENIYHHLLRPDRPQMDVEKVIEESTLEVQKPMLFSMLIVILAYTPLLSLRYIEGLLFRPMALTLCFAFVGALLMAVFVVPALAASLFNAENLKAKKEDILDIVTEKYQHLLEKLVQRSRAIGFSAIAILLLSFVIILPKMGTEFLPYMDEGVFWVRANFPEGISLKENAYFSSKMRGILKEFEEVSFVTSQTGRNDTGTDPFPTNRTEILVGLKPREEWKNYNTKLELEAALYKRLTSEFPTIKLNLTQPIIDSVTEDTNGTSANLAIEIQGPDLKVLRNIADEAVALLKTIDGNRNVNIEQEGPQPQLKIVLDRSRLAQYQLSADAVNDVINTAVGGQAITDFFEGERRYDILVKYQKEQVSSPQEISKIPVFNQVGEAIPLGQVANIRIVEGETLIARSNAQRRITVRCDIRERSQGDFVAEAQNKFERKIKIPSGYKISWLGMFENLARAKSHFGWLVPATIIVIFIILFSAFTSLKRAGLVLMTLPFALLGGLIALWCRDMNMSVSAGVGFTSLFGVAAMHGVLLISSIHQLRVSQNISAKKAAILGAARRFKPVVMTASVAILGLLPASLSSGIGSDIQRPIATVIVWGLMGSMLMTLFIMPIFYTLVEKDNETK